MINYQNDVLPLESDDRTDAEIAVMINAKSSRFKQDQRTILELVARLIETGTPQADAQAAVDSLLSNLSTATAQSKVLESTYQRLMSGGTIDVGSPAMRIAIMGLGGQSIVDSFPLSVPLATAENVAASRSAYGVEVNRSELLAFCQRLNGAANIAAQAIGATRESVLAAIATEAEA